MTLPKRFSVQIALAILLFATPVLFAKTLAPKKSLKDRVGAAKTVFVGKIVNRVQKGEWVRAELLVEQPLSAAKKGEKVEVIWRATLGAMKIYDAEAGARGIAILVDKHEGRFWLRADKFEPIAQLDAVKKLIPAQPSKPAEK